MFRRIFEAIKKWVHSRTKTVKKEVNAMSILICEINGNVVPMAVGSMRAATAINNRGTASFVVYEQNAVTIQEGMNVLISRSDTLSVIFSGKIESVRDVFSLSENLHTLHINAVGWERIADRRIIAEVYRNRTAGYIVADIVAKYFAADGITVGVIEDGDMIPAATFAYRPAADVLRSLSEANDFVWFIDHSKALHFQPRSFSSAPWQIDTVADPAGVNSAGVREVSKYRALEQYRNRQYLKYSEISAERTESFGGDGLTRTWNVELPIAQAPAVSVNGFAQTVGISGIDTGKDFYWNKGSAAITADAGNAPPSARDNIEVGQRMPIYPRSREYSYPALRGDLYAVWEPDGAGTTGRLSVYTVSLSGISLVNSVQATSTVGSFGGQICWVRDDIILLRTSYFGYSTYQLIGKEIVALDTTFTPGGGKNWQLQRQVAGSGTYAWIFNFNFGLFDNVELNTLIVDDDGSITQGTPYDTGLAYFNATGIPATDGLHTIVVDTVGKEVRCYVCDPTTGVISEKGRAPCSDARSSTTIFFVGEYVFAYNSGNSANVHIYRITSSGFSKIKEQWIPRNLGNFATTYGNRVLCIVPIGVDWDNWHVLEFDAISENLLLISAFNHPLYDTSVTMRPDGVGICVNTGTPDDRSDRVNLLLPLPARISVTYRGTYPNVLLSDDPSEQAGRAIIEGGTGIYAAYQNAPDAEGELAAIDIAQTILERYGRVPERFEFTCTREGLQAGQILPVNWPDMGIAEDYLIESVQATDTGGTVIWYRIKAISGRDVGNWQEFWRSLRETDSYDFGGGDTLPVPRSVRDVITEAWTDSAVTDVVAAQTQWDLATFDIDEWQ